jgi:hypothetical protein
MHSPLKVMVLIKKRSDISTEQFRRHYESVHAPLVDRLLPFYSAYRRNYIDGPVRSEPFEFGWDVFTELEFPNQPAYDDWLSALSDPDVLAQIRADEANFIEPGTTRMLAVTAFASHYPDLP